MLSKELEFTLSLAFREVRKKRHEFITVEHLLLALTQNPAAAEVLRARGADLSRLAEELSEFIADNIPILPDEEDRDIQPTLGFQRVLQRAVHHVQSSGKKDAEVTGANVLVAMFSERESYAIYLLEQHDVARLDVVNYIAHGISKVSLDAENEHTRSMETDKDGSASDTQKPLDYFAVNLNELAIGGKIDPLVGREREIERTIQILCRRRKNNPLFIGEAGVGKTAIAEGLARKIVENKVPKVLANSTIYSLDIGGLIAGTKYRGDFERRFKGVLHQLQGEQGAILFIDEIHTIIGAGSVSGGAMDASNLIKPILNTGELKCIGSTTYHEFRGVFEKDRALARRFQSIEIEEPDIDHTYRILKGLRSRFEEHHGVRYTEKALKAAAELSAKHINDRHLPDKAIDVIDEAGANMNLRPKSTRKKTITVKQVEEIVAKIARIPPRHVSSSDTEVLKNLERNLKMVVFGQNDAIANLSTAIKMSRSGIGGEDNPIGSFLFAGPTGVGKTEVTRQLALILGIELLRFDMSEYMERHTVSRLIGAPPGYVGFDQGGLLTDAVLKSPHCVLLLDEVEKAHPDVFNLLLQAMDHGTLTDTNGRRVDFRNVILVMTTNAGAQEMSRSSVGFTVQDHNADGVEIIRRTFTPEFRNRLDAVIQFAPLSQETVMHVVDKFVAQLEAQLECKKVEIQVEASAKTWIAGRGYDAKMGARPMQRVIQEYVKKPLAEEILFGCLENGGKVVVCADKGELNIKYLRE